MNASTATRWTWVPATALLAAGVFTLDVPTLDYPSLGRLTLGAIEVIAGALIAVAGGGTEPPSQRLPAVLILLPSILLSCHGTSEPEAAQYALPAWAAAFGAFLLGRALRHVSDAAAGLLVALGCVAWLAAGAIPAWPVATLAWTLACLGVGRAPALRESRGLILGMLVFVLATLGLTIQQYVEASRFPFVVQDGHAAGAALVAHRLGGWGENAYGVAMMVHSVRSPGLGPFSGTGFTRLLVDLGAVKLALLGAGLLVPFVVARRSEEGSRTHILALGCALLLTVAMLTRRAGYESLLPCVFAAWGIASGSGVEGCGRRWAGALVLMLGGLALMPWVMTRAPRSAGPSQLPGRLPRTSQQLRTLASSIREASPELAKSQDPRDLLEVVVKRWRTLAPHDEWMLVESIRLGRSRGIDAYRTAVEEAAQAAPWSPILALWRARFHVEQGEPDKALESLRTSKPHDHPVVARRMAELTRARIQREQSQHGHRD